MPLSTDIRLPKGRTPAFPDRCVACGAPRPGDFLRLAVRRATLGDLVFPWLWFTRKPARCEVPACAGCRVAASWQRRLRYAVLFAALGAMIPVLIPLVKSWGLPRGWTRLLTLVLVLLPALPWALWITLRPPPIDLTVGKDTVEYEFADAGYAAEFAAINKGSAPDAGHPARSPAS